MIHELPDGAIAFLRNAVDVRITLAASSGQQTDSFEDHGKLSACYMNGGIIGKPGRQAKSSLFEPFVPDRKAIVVP